MNEKERRRYLVFRIEGEEKFKKDEVLGSMNKTGIHFFGELEFSKIKTWLVDFNFEKQKGILRINNKKNGEAKTILLLMTNIKDKKVRLNSLGISGTLKKSRCKWW